MKNLEKVQKFKDYLESQNLRLTKERRSVLAHALDFTEPFCVDDLLFSMIRNSYKTSKATIYRTLPLLVSCGLLTEIIDAQNQIRYEHCTEYSKLKAHLICLRCSKIIEFQDPEIRKREQQMCAENLFQPTKFRHEILGYCSQCRMI